MAVIRTPSDAESDEGSPRLTIQHGITELCVFNNVVIGGRDYRIVTYALADWQDIPRNERPDGGLSEDGKSVIVVSLRIETS